VTEDYSDLLLEHARNPKNYGHPLSEHTTVRRYNKVCGDVVEVHRELLTGLFRFTGKGCVVSQAVSSCIIELTASYDHTYLAGVALKALKETGAITIPELLFLESLLRFPLRRKCALLVVECLEEFQ
jgi:nitrogen fixation protein NifU and related proteins